MLDTAASYRLSEVIGALSHALDLTEGQPVGHSQRSCMIGMEIGARLGLPGEVQRDLFYAILLKDAGCSSSAARMCELFATDDRALKREFSFVDWTSTGRLRALRGAQRRPRPVGASRGAGSLLRALRGIAREADDLNNARCDRGARIVAMLGFPAAASEAVRALDEHWDGSGRPDGLGGRRHPPHLPHRLPVADRRDLHVGRRPPGRARRGAGAPRPLVRPGDQRPVPRDRAGRPALDPARGRLDGRGAARPGAPRRASRWPTRRASTGWRRRSRASSTRSRPTPRATRRAWRPTPSPSASRWASTRCGCEACAGRRCCTTSASSGCRT